MQRKKGRDQIIIICCCCSEKDIGFFMKNKLTEVKQMTSKQLWATIDKEHVGSH